ncbi:unnamed protein product [Cuscuta campestris]|uniref:Uncharacterized protein n=1 Tax=Cuscuta campestris TaxID=132261 RepID=A0A484NNZ2_9ASTE|nr:unnamed protein product [Cuscuta campestris]
MILPSIIYTSTIYKNKSLHGERKNPRRLTYSHGPSINHFGGRGALNIAEEEISSPLIPHSGLPPTIGGMS